MNSCLSYKTPTDEADTMRELVSGQLTAQGFNEIMNNSLTARSYYEDFEPYPADGCVELLNPLSGDLSVMRRTLLFGGLESLAHNINRRSTDLMFYEFGNVYAFDPTAQADADKPLAPYSEGARLALWLTGDMRQASWMGAAEPVTFYHIKAVVEALLARLGVSGREVAFPQIDMPGLYSAALAVDTRSGKRLGTLGMVSRKQLKRFGIEQDVMYAELDWDALVKLSLKRKVTYSPLAKTHPVRRDMALLLDKEVAFDRVEAVIRRQ